jgi:transcriptional regulator with XRE-family HTH domain
MRLFAERLRAAREAKGWSQTILAQRTGLDLGNINELEQAKKASVRAESLIPLAEMLGISTDYLLGLTDDARPRPRRQRPAAAAAASEEDAA